MSDDAFRRAFKYYKARKDAPDLSLPLNLSNKKQSIDNVTKVDARQTSTDHLEWLKFGMKPPNEWEAFTINKNKGLIFIKNPFYNIGQRYWIVRCLRDFPKKPHKLNIDIHNDLSDIKDWWTAYVNSDDDKAKQLKRSLRWATLGYHHDWDSKLYTEKNRHDFPTDLAEMCRLVTACFGFDDYSAEASIVNYYHLDSTLAPHTDHSEKNLDAPLVSISFGQSAIFLIGGESKDIEPSAIYLHSGDIIIMSKKSRLCYHAVPRVLKSDDKPWELEDYSSYLHDFEVNKKSIEHYDIFEKCNYNKFWKPFEDYVCDSRINLNVRQVLHKDQTSLES